MRDAPDPRLPHRRGDVLRHALHPPRRPAPRLRVHQHLVLAVRRRRAVRGVRRGGRRRSALQPARVRVPRRVRHRADDLGRRRLRRAGRDRRGADRRAADPRRRRGPARQAAQAPQERRPECEPLVTDLLLFKDIDEPDLHTIDVYERRGGYDALRKALGMSREDVLAELDGSGIRGRGGAGFAMGKKASFLHKDAMDQYHLHNPHESEPGTFKDRELMQKTPHMLVEGMIIAAYVIGATRAFIYIRGDYDLQADRLEAAVEEAKGKGYLGDDILGSGHSLTLWVHRGAGAYICGEETALLDSL